MKHPYSFAFVFIVAVVAVLLTVVPLRAEIDPQYGPQLEQLIAKLKLRGFTDDEIGRIFSDNRVELYPLVVEKSGKDLDYFDRKFGLLTKKSIQKGQTLLRDNREILAAIEETFGVEKEIILGILRVETNFGANTGGYSVFNSLLSMTLIGNRRSSWAQKELIELLSTSKEQNQDPLSLRGSWAGAFGMCQFVPTSYAQFAVDGNGDGTIDLFDFHDATASIANYLKLHGYEKHRPGGNRDANFAYNHCDNYVKAIIAYAEALER